jgi:hypothetical protein
MADQYDRHVDPRIKLTDFLATHDGTDIKTRIRSFPQLDFYHTYEFWGIALKIPMYHDYIRANERLCISLDGESRTEAVYGLVGMEKMSEKYSSGFKLREALREAREETERR